MSHIKLKRLNANARLPAQAPDSVGFDLFASQAVELAGQSTTLVPTGWALADEPIVSGTCIHGNLRTLLKIEGRSGLALRAGIWPVGGIIDPGYRGEIGVIMYNSSARPYHVELGHRIAQFVWYPVVTNWPEYGRAVNFIEVEDAKSTATVRGSLGFGSSGI